MNASDVWCRGRVPVLINTLGCNPTGGSEIPPPHTHRKLGPHLIFYVNES